MSLTWWRAHVTHHWGQSHQQLGALVVGEVVHLNELALQNQVWVLRRRSEQIRDALDGALVKSLDHMVVLGEGGCDAPGSNLGLEVSSYTTIVQMNTISQTLYNHNSITSTLIQGVSETLHGSL